MNNIEEENYRKYWAETYQENQQIDSLTDQRIRAGIQRKIKAGRSYKKLYWTAAAVIIGIGVTFYTPSSSYPQKIITKTEQYSSVDYTKRVNLPDGSSIIMEPHSSIILSADFGKTDRKITFTGKATFDIAKDKTRPFRINAKDFTVQVLGTKFFLDQTHGKEKV